VLVVIDPDGEASSSMNGRVLFSKFSPAANATSTTATRPWGGGAGRFPGCSTNITSTQLS